MMKLYALISVFSLISCTYFNKNKQIDTSTLTGEDYRLFQNTPALQLAKAVRNEDEKKIKEILANQPNLINFQEPKFGNTLLLLTIMNQQVKPFQMLLDNKADINLHNTYDGTSALIESCSFKQYDIEFVKLLLQKGANVNDLETGERRQGNSTRFTPLMAAAKTGRLDIVELLIKSGANVNIQNEFKQSALSIATLIGRYNIVYYLLNNGADFSHPIFYREEGNKNMYLVDVLREDFCDLNTEDHKYKMEVVSFLSSKGIEYKDVPIPEFIKKKAQEYYPNNWKEYLNDY